MAGWYQLLDKKLKLYYDGFYQPAISKSFNYRTQYDIGLDIPLWKGISFTSIYSQTRENVVSKSSSQIDENLTFGLLGLYGPYPYLSIAI
jgi:hypothetical protein